MLKLMYITNRPDIARIAEAAGTDRIFLDLEFIGKDARQKGLDTVKSHHTFADVAAVRAAVKTAEVLVRVNPIHEALPDYPSSEAEIDAVVRAGADILMLPFFKTPGEVEAFLRMVKGRARTMLLLETPEAVDHLDEILEIPGIDEIHIGLNDLSLGYGMKFMFQLLSDGTVEQLFLKIRRKGIPCGFGGIAALGGGMLPAEYIIREHYRLDSRFVILSRSFCDLRKMQSTAEVEATFRKGIQEIRALEAECEIHAKYFRESRIELQSKVAEICGKLGST